MATSISQTYSKAVAAHWDDHIATTGSRNNWWSSNACTAQYNAAICGEALPGNARGVGIALAQVAGRLGRGVSVGAGTGDKERALVVNGQVDEMVLWELSPKRMETARDRADAAGVVARMQFQVGNAFVQETGQFDLVHWDHSLHHMSDIDEAMRWSLARLRPGGWLMINDYFGPNRLQWRPDEVKYCNTLLAGIDRQHGSNLRRVRHSNFITQLRIRYRDPSEAPCSETMASAITRHLGPTAQLRPTGGMVMNILGGIIVPAFADDHPAIAAMLDADREALAAGNWHFGFLLWQKPTATV